MQMHEWPHLLSARRNWRLLLVASRLSVAMLELEQVSWVLGDLAWDHTYAHEAFVGQPCAMRRRYRLQTAVTAATGKRVTRDAFASLTQTVVFETKNGKASSVSKACTWTDTRWLSTRSPCGDSTLESPVILPGPSVGGMSNASTHKLSASRAQTKASHKRARGKAPSWTPTRLRRLQAQHMHNNALVIRKPPDAMASKQHGHSKVAWTDARLARAGEHEGLSGSFGGKGVAQGNAGTRKSRLEAVEARKNQTNADKSGKVQRHISPEKD